MLTYPDLPELFDQVTVQYPEVMSNEVNPEIIQARFVHWVVCMHWFLEFQAIF